MYPGLSSVNTAQQAAATYTSTSTAACFRLLVYSYEYEVRRGSPRILPAWHAWDLRNLISSTSDMNISISDAQCVPAHRLFQRPWPAGRPPSPRAAASPHRQQRSISIAYWLASLPATTVTPFLLSLRNLPRLQQWRPQQWPPLPPWPPAWLCVAVLPGTGCALRL